jgi:hypothetical protein
LGCFLYDVYGVDVCDEQFVLVCLAMVCLGKKTLKKVRIWIWIWILRAWIEEKELELKKTTL